MSVNNKIILKYKQSLQKKKTNKIEPTFNLKTKYDKKVAITIDT